MAPHLTIKKPPIHRFGTRIVLAISSDLLRISVVDVWPSFDSRPSSISVRDLVPDQVSLDRGLGILSSSDERMRSPMPPETTILNVTTHRRRIWCTTLFVRFLVLVLNIAVLALELDRFL